MDAAIEYIVSEGKRRGKSKEEVSRVVARYLDTHGDQAAASATATAPPPRPMAPGVTEEVPYEPAPGFLSAIGQGAKNLPRSAWNMAEGAVSGATGAVTRAGRVISDPLARAVGVQPAPPTGGEQTLDRFVSGLVDMQQNPGAAMDASIRATGDTRILAEDPAAFAMNAGMAGTLARPLMGGSKGPVQGIVTRGAGPESALRELIKKKYEKGVRPTVVGKGSEPLMQKASARQQSAVESILSNKDKLKLTDEYGEPVAGTPQTLRQFSQAIDQTKGNIFAKYDAMAKAAGKGGAVVDMTPIASELRKMATGKAVNTAAPGTAKYIADLADRFDGVTMTPIEAQEAITIYNKKLEAYFKNPSPDTANTAGVDSVVADRLRGRLDAAIESLEGPGYQQLKRQYGALKSIEKEVAHRTIVDARKNNKGLADLIGDVASAGEIAIALTTASPTAALRGGAIQAAKVWWKHRNDPNVIVREMFKKADRLVQKREAAKKGKAITPATASDLAPGEYPVVREEVTQARRALPREKNPVVAEAETAITEEVPVEPVERNTTTSRAGYLRGGDEARVEGEAARGLGRTVSEDTRVLPGERAVPTSTLRDFELAGREVAESPVAASLRSLEEQKTKGGHISPAPRKTIKGIATKGESDTPVVHLRSIVKKMSGGIEVSVEGRAFGDYLVHPARPVSGGNGWMISRISTGETLSDARGIKSKPEAIDIAKQWAGEEKLETPVPNELPIERRLSGGYVPIEGGRRHTDLKAKFGKPASEKLINGISVHDAVDLVGRGEAQKVARHIEKGPLKDNPAKAWDEIEAAAKKAGVSERFMNDIKRERKMSESRERK